MQNQRRRRPQLEAFAIGILGFSMTLMVLAVIFLIVKAFAIYGFFWPAVALSAFAGGIVMFNYFAHYNDTSP